jgi:SAM-dependent methyltransferase
MNVGPYDFGYTWPWTHGHLVLAIPFALGALAAWRLRWRWWWRALLAALTVWAIVAFVLVQLAFGYYQPVELPTSQFLRSNTGKVLDVGCGSGRASIGVLRARPGTTLVALDNFSADYIAGNGPDLLRRNLRAAGVEGRLAQIVSADMRKIPLADGSFDAVVSTYAIDHVNREGSRQTIKEVGRVLRPGGEFLLLLMRADWRLRMAYPIPHMGTGRQAGWWRTTLAEEGFDVVEEGTRPATTFFLARKR